MRITTRKVNNEPRNTKLKKKSSIEDNNDNDNDRNVSVDNENKEIDKTKMIELKLDKIALDIEFIKSSVRDFHKKLLTALKPDLPIPKPNPTSSRPTAAARHTSTKSASSNSNPLENDNSSNNVKQVVEEKHFIRNYNSGSFLF